MRINGLAAILPAGCFAAVLASAQTAETLPAYRAVYDAHYRERRVGESEFSVIPVADSTGVHEFRSVSRLKGLYRLFVPGPVEEISTFVLEDGRIRPLSYSLRGGSRGGNNDLGIAFDWEQGIATTTARGVDTHAELVPGVLDRGSLQVTLMLRGTGGPESYTMLGEDGLEIHSVQADGEEIIETPLGVFSTRKSIQQRLNSSRRTLIWSAPELHDLPVRIERQSRGETRAAFHLRSVEWLEPTDP